MRMQSQSRHGLLNRVFRHDEKQPVDAFIARAAVLYEDLRIEREGIFAESIQALDVLYPSDEETVDPHKVGLYRRNYFLRRSICTLYEFCETITKLDGFAGFERVRREMLTRGADARCRPRWDEAVAFFRRNEARIKEVRHDVGGHFGEKAARWAVQHLQNDAVGHIERANTPKGKDLRLYFAGEIVATAIYRNLSTSKSNSIVDFENFVT